ncbi:MAG: aldehyde dehydrogenase family protein [Chloroflexi bacterium]|nr:aldehyde dehydrogenase family protein [Chloroflexota bacterium]
MQGKNYIGGEWVSSPWGETFEDINPANTQEVVGVFPKSNQKDVEEAVKVAREAYSTWRRLSRIKRGEYLDNFVQLVKAEAEELAYLMAKECGKAINECRADVVEGIHMTQFMFGRSRTPYGDVVASEIGEKDAYMLRRPKGVIAAISPWNFPFAIPTWLIMPSLLEGNTVIFKPSEETPLMAHKIAEYFHRVGLPAGVFNLIQGHGPQAGWPLVTHPDVDVVLFVGSAPVGAEIKKVCAADYRKMAACEMGGKNAIIVCDDANLELAVNAAILSAFKTSGQRCVSASRLIVHEKVIDAFSKAFVETAKRIVIGDPVDEKVFMGPVINQKAVDKITFYNNLAREEGAEILLKGGRLDGEGYRQGYFMSPFIYRMKYDSRPRVLREEVFGPHVAIVPFRTLEEAIHIHNDVEYGLAMSVITEDYRKARTLREECEYGVGYVNLPSIGAEVHLPFGGLKKSGTGLPSASTLIDAVTHRVAWTVNNATEIKMAQGLSAAV